MDAMYGEAGATGLDSLPKDLMWRHTDAVDRGPYGVLPECVPHNWRDAYYEIERKARGAETNRLTGPIQFVLKLLESWRLETSHAVRLLGFDSDDADHVTAVLGGYEQFRGRDVKDRISHLFFIRKTLWSLFRDSQTENDWLRQTHSMLDDKTPLSLLLGGSMEDLLLTRDYVELAAGR